MAILVLDLDMTVFAHTSLANNVLFWSDEEKSIGFKPVRMDGRLCEFRPKFDPALSFNVKLICPDLLTDLIEYAYTEHDGVIFLTAGSWEENSVKTLLLDELKLSSEAAEKLKQAIFINPFTTMFEHYKVSKQRYEQFVNSNSEKGHIEKLSEAEYRLGCFEQSRSEPKIFRLKQFVANVPGYNDQGFVLVDDDSEHVQSVAKQKHFRGVLATTRKDFFDEKDEMTDEVIASCKEFYNKAKDSLDELKSILQNKNKYIEPVLQRLDTNSPPSSPIKQSLKRSRVESWSQDAQITKRAKMTSVGFFGMKLRSQSLSANEEAVIKSTPQLK